MCSGIYKHEYTLNLHYIKVGKTRGVINKVPKVSRCSSLN